MPAPGDVLPPVVTNLIALLPGDGETWTIEQRDRWLVALVSALVLVYPVEDFA